MAKSHDAHDDYVRGSQEISEQESTFGAFVGLTKWGSLIISASLLFLTIWFQPGGAFIPAAISAVVLLVAGFFMMKSPRKSH
jgi:xanthine/uracil/vitamin C permease (AzgA family)